MSASQLPPPPPDDRLGQPLPPPPAPVASGFPTPPPAYSGGVAPNAPWARSMAHRPDPASFGLRLAAFLIDRMILAVVGLVLFWGLLVSVPSATSTCTIDGELALCDLPTATGWLMLVAAAIGVFALYVWFWMGTMVGVNGQTPGKMMVGIRIVDIDTGEPIGRGRGIGRSFMEIVSGSFCYLGYFWMLWDADKQTLHDKVVTSTVVKAQGR